MFLLLLLPCLSLASAPLPDNMLGTFQLETSEGFTNYMYEAWEWWNNEFGYFLNKMDCGFYYNIAIGDVDPAEDSYEEFCNMESTREALHVGNLPFPDPCNVYFSMINVFMEMGMHDIEFCLDHKYYYGSEVVGYLKQARNLDIILVKNVGHMVPLSQPLYAQQMLEDFTSGKM